MSNPSTSVWHLNNLWPRETIHFNAMTVEQALKEALRLQEARQYPQAEALYRQILVHNPNQPDTLHLLGVLFYEDTCFRRGD